MGSRELLAESNANKLICPIRNPRTDIFLIAKVERLLSDSPSDIYSKNSGIADTKATAKLLKSIRTAGQKLSQYRSSFGWAVSPVFPSICNTSSSQPIKSLQLYKCDARLTDVDLQKYLNEFVKLEKSGKLVPIPGATLTVNLEITPSVVDLPMRLSPSLLPLRPWRAPADSPLAPAFELQSFVNEALVAEPYKSCVNMLYVYPISLNYGSQKAFNRARNIACTVSFVAGTGRKDSAGSLKPSAFIVDRTDSQQGPIVSSKTCTVQYHEQNPQFDDEIKVQLPCHLDATDHLLFTFKHISVANALSPKASSNEQAFESPIGYAWLPLVRQSNDTFKYLIMSEDSEFFDLPVAVNLPPGYVKSQMSQVSPDLKFVENGRPLFRIRLRLISSVFSTDEHVQSFFQCCQNIESTCQTTCPCDEEYKSNNNRKFSSSVSSHLNRSCSPYVESRTDETSTENTRTTAEFRRIIDKIKVQTCS
uniref:C2 DOCK-type domain-containing protein n=1 Tax=Ditylenchus dipsaci TaxID=166011 RepID=A0A915EUX6_9BILA